MAALARRLAPGGCLAVQMPDNINEPSHALMREVAARPQFRAKLGHAAAAREAIGDFADYDAALAPICEAVDLWRTTYFHPLAGARAIVEWLKGTGLRPFLDPLEENEREAFLARYEAAIAKAYPAETDGTVLLPFPRLFVVAAR